MIGLPNPYLIIGAIVVASGLYFYGHHKGWDERDKEMQIAIAKKNEEARALEQKLNEQVNQTASKLMEAQDAVTQKQSALDMAIRAGRMRLPTTSCVSVPPSPAPASGNSQETRTQPTRQTDEPSESERATLEAIAAIVAQGDKNTQQLNACIDAYNTLREQMNVKR